MMNLCQVIRELSCSSLMSNCMVEVMMEPVGSLRLASMFRPLLPSSWQTILMTRPSCCTKILLHFKVDFGFYSEKNIQTYFVERSSKSPQSAKSARLQKVKRLLRSVLRRQHVLNNTLDCCQHDLIVRWRQHIVDLRIEQWVTENESF